MQIIGIIISLGVIFLMLGGGAFIFLRASTIEIGENEVGIVYKRFNPFFRSLLNGQMVALNGEAGPQPETLPHGKHFRYSPLLYEIRRVPIVKVPPEQIALIVAKDGESLPKDQILGKVVDCNDFQDARAFLTNGGQKGQQLGILTAGEYRINTVLFDVITSENAIEKGVDPESLEVYEIPTGMIGIVKTQDGIQVPEGEIAGPIIKGHNNFQNGQVFLDSGGQKGLQEEILHAAKYNLNPWFVEVEQVPLTNIRTGTVGVVISDVGTENPNKDELVDEGFKGICKVPLYPGQHATNTKIKSVELVPTQEITLDWSNKTKPPTNYDSNLDALKLRSKDGFELKVEVTQVIRIKSTDAPKMISRIGFSTSEETIIQSNGGKYPSIRNLITKVLEPMISNHFRNSAQDYNALDFHELRSERQREAIEHIRTALNAYGVQAVDTFINEIDLPPKLEEPLNAKSAAKMELEAEFEKQKIVRAQEEFKTEIVQMEAERTRIQNQIDAEGISMKFGGIQNYLEDQRIQKLPDIKLPEVFVGGGSGTGSSSGMGEALFAQMLGNRTDKQIPEQVNIIELIRILHVQYTSLMKIVEDPNPEKATEVLEQLGFTPLPIDSTSDQDTSSLSA